MNFRLKVNLVLLFAALLVMVPGGWYINKIVREQANLDVVKQANMLMESALATRSYTTDLVKPQLDPMLADKFLPQTVPAFAATETFERFRKKFAISNTRKRSWIRPTPAIMPMRRSARSSTALWPIHR